jgi:hypothetical protein
MAARMKTLALGAVLAALAAPGWAASSDDPDWPCIQRKVDTIAMFQMWSGPMPEGAWRDDEAIRREAARLAPRRVPIEEVEAAAAELVDGMPDDERAETLGQLFNGIVDLIQRERQEIMGGIARYARSQARLAERVDAQQAELRVLNAQAEKDWDAIEELQDTVDWDARLHRERAQSLTYVCETPVLLEQRAFAIGRALAGLL